MDAFEDLAAVGDIAELEHITNLLEEAAKDGSGPLDGLTGWESHLVKRLGHQDGQSKKIVEAAHPGLYARTWIAEVFTRLYSTLDAVTEKPYQLAGELQGIKLDLHKVHIAAHVVFDDRLRKELIADATRVGKAAGAAEANKIRSEQAARAVAFREDQRDRADFAAWIKPFVAEGKSARNVTELKTWDGYSIGAWCEYPATTIKKWALAAGHPKFRTGRASKSSTKRGK
ncbi:MAG: hypothetical protein WC023_01990 [Rhodocyclaceae bacterium]